MNKANPIIPVSASSLDDKILKCLRTRLTGTELTFFTQPAAGIWQVLRKVKSRNPTPTPINGSIVENIPAGLPVHNTFAKPQVVSVFD